jgi:hypothetical protein
MPFWRSMLRTFQLFGEWRAKRDERLWDNFEQFVACTKRDNSRICEVVYVTAYYPRKGTKAKVRWIVPSGEINSVWIEHTHLRMNQLLLISGSYGHGPHHQEVVFYIDKGCQVLNRRTYAGWEKHKARHASPRTA